MLEIQNFIQNNFYFIAIFCVLLWLVIAIWLMTVQISLSKFKKRNREFFSGNKVDNIEEFLLEQSKNLKLLDKDIQELYNISNQINKLALQGIHKTSLIRFNPFKDVGGDQSFSLALLDGKNNGLVLSSLFTREGTRIYSKSIVNGISEKYPLTDIEEKVIKQAMKNEISKKND